MEDVIILVGGIKVLAYFIVLDVGRGTRCKKDHLLLLGWPFMSTTQARIDVGSDILSMAGEGGSVTFSVFEKSPLLLLSLSINVHIFRLLMIWMREVLCRPCRLKFKKKSSLKRNS